MAAERTPLHISTKSCKMSRAGASLLRMYTAPTAHSRYLSRNMHPYQQHFQSMRNLKHA